MRRTIPSKYYLLKTITAVKEQIDKLNSLNDTDAVRNLASILIWNCDFYFGEHIASQEWSNDKFKLDMTVNYLCSDKGSYKAFLRIYELHLILFKSFVDYKPSKFYMEGTMVYIFFDVNNDSYAVSYDKRFEMSSYNRQDKIKVANISNIIEKIKVNKY
jgi:hypothetical protein